MALYKNANFLTNGDLVTYKLIEDKRFMNKAIRKTVILTYSSNTKNNNWICKFACELNEMNETEISGIINNKLWVLLNKNIFILDLITFQYRKILLEINVCIIV